MQHWGLNTNTQKPLLAHMLEKPKVIQWAHSTVLKNVEQNLSAVFLCRRDIISCPSSFVDKDGVPEK